MNKYVTMRHLRFIRYINMTGRKCYSCSVNTPGSLYIKDKDNALSFTCDIHKILGYKKIDIDEYEELLLVCNIMHM